MDFFSLVPMTVSVSLMELIHLHIYVNKFSSSFINECISAFVRIWGRMIIERKQNENGTCYFFSLLLTCKLDASEGYKNTENHIKPNTIHDKWRRRQANEQSKVSQTTWEYSQCVRIVRQDEAPHFKMWCFMLIACAVNNNATSSIVFDVTNNPLLINYDGK